MNLLQLFASLILVVQIVHSIEEITTGFHKRWFFFKMSFKFFLIFEILHNLFWIAVVLFQQFPYRLNLLALFIVLMFAQSLWHLAWWTMEKKYVPGLITAIIHVALFLVFYFQYVRF